MKITGGRHVGIIRLITRLITAWNNELVWNLKLTFEEAITILLGKTLEKLSGRTPMSEKSLEQFLEKHHEETNIKFIEGFLEDYLIWLLGLSLVKNDNEFLMETICKCLEGWLE